MFLRLTKDDVSPALTRLARTAQRPAPVFRAMGTTFKSLTEGNFSSLGAAYRPKPWPAKPDGTPSILQLSGAMVHSFHLEVTDDHATLSNPMRYTAIHQFGGKIVAKGKALTWLDSQGARHFAKSVTIPARPFFPVDEHGKLTPMAEEKIRCAGERAIARQAGAVE